MLCPGKPVSRKPANCAPFTTLPFRTYCVPDRQRGMESVVPDAIARPLRRKGEESRAVGYFNFPAPITCPVFDRYLVASVHPEPSPLGDVEDEDASAFRKRFIAKGVASHRSIA